MKLSILGSALLVAALNLVLAIEPQPDAENVCNRTENIKKERLVKKPIEYPITVDSMCGLLSCKKTFIHKTTDTTRETYYVEVTRRECCEGYAITPERTCEPICLKACQFGKCVGPNQCECSPAPLASQPGYSGPQCNRFVCEATDRWGPNCDKESSCPETAYCEARTGKCLCRPGWRGSNCTEECTTGASGCEDLPFLPSLFEPEVNIIKTDDTVAGRASALSLSDSTADQSTDSESDKRAFSRMLMTHLHINLFLVILVSGLMFILFVYRNKLNRMRNELYYAAYPGSQPRGSSDSSSSGGYASVYQANSTIAGRPRMPLPGETNYLSKEMNFDAATRNAINDTAAVAADGLQKGDQKHVFIPFNSKAERHLVMSKEPAQQNIYSDIEANLDCILRPAATAEKLTIPTSENEYQVPRSPAARASSDETNSHANLYEELVPNSPDSLKSQTQK